MDNKQNFPQEEQRSILFLPDMLLADQYSAVFRKTSPLEPEKSLMMAILEDAIDCYQKYLRAKDKRGKGLFHEAEDWILATDPDWLFSFDNVCDTLGLQPDYLRQGLVRWKEIALMGGHRAKVSGRKPSKTKKNPNRQPRASLSSPP
jgi:hypothetical protein